MNESPSHRYSLDGLQRTALTLMAGLTLLSFAATNLQAVLWQSSNWLVSTVLPAVVVDLTNEERAENAATQLQRNETLDAAARLKAKHMAENEYFSHYSPDGVSPWHWFGEAGYVYAHAGENLAVHFTDSAEVVEAWMDSPTHRANIVDRKFTEIGVGTAKGEFQGYDTVYVVQLFGAPGATTEPTAPPDTSITNGDTREVATSTLATAESASNVPPSTPSAPPVTAPSNTAPPAVAAESPTPTSAGVAASEDEAEPTSTPLAEETDPNPPLTEPLPERSASTPTAPPEAIPSLAPAADELAAQVDTEVPTSTVSETVVVTSPTISTSSGLAIAQITSPNPPHAGATMASLITQPNALLQLTYLVFGVVVVGLLSLSIVFEARRQRFVQVAYGFALLFGMGGLWFLQSWLVSGALIA